MITAKPVCARVMALLSAWGWKGSNVDWASIKPAVLDQIISWIGANCGRPVVGVHVGNLLGVSLAVLGSAAKDLDENSVILAIDPDLPCRGYERMQEAVTRVLRELDIEDVVLRLAGYSLHKSVRNEGRVDDEIVAQWQLSNLTKLIRGKVDFVLLDGNHNGMYVEEEVMVCHRLLKPGGAIFIHDITRHYPGLQKAFYRTRQNPIFSSSFELSNDVEVRMGVLVKGVS